ERRRWCWFDDGERVRERERESEKERESGLNRWEYSFCVRNRMDWSCVGGGEKNNLLMSF
ncbi:unnamed protein product, partial [Schistosoma bovis]